MKMFVLHRLVKCQEQGVFGRLKFQNLISGARKAFFGHNCPGLHFKQKCHKITFVCLNNRHYFYFIKFSVGRHLLVVARREKVPNRRAGSAGSGRNPKKFLSLG